jgi:hypothetical protein
MCAASANSALPVLHRHGRRYSRSRPACRDRASRKSRDSRLRKCRIQCPSDGQGLVGATLKARFTKSAPLGVAACTVLVLTSCVSPPPEVPPDELIRRLQAGEPALECGLPCQDAWRANRSTALVLNETRQWRELAVLVMQIGYTNDLTYYYLGRAAEGLGFWDAAKTYYRISVRLTSAGITCRAEGADYCNGQVFPAVAQTELVELTAPPPTPPTPSKTHRAQPQHRPPAKPTPPPAPASAQTTAPASTGAAVMPEAAPPDFAAPPPVRR